MLAMVGYEAEMIPIAVEDEAIACINNWLLHTKTLYAYNKGKIVKALDMTQDEMECTHDTYILTKRIILLNSNSKSEYDKNVAKELITGDTKQQWMELIKADSKEALEMVRTSTSSPDIRQGIETIYELNADVALREQILARDKAVRDYENDMAAARDEGKAEGRAEGRLEGLKQALTNLIANGMEESQAKKILGL